MNPLFLDVVLPSSGYLCAVQIKAGVVKQKFTADRSEIQALAEAADANGADAYFALASYSTKSRKAEHAEYLRSLFVDIDCGPHKPYPAIFDAAQALRVFVEAVELPEPLIVNSGGGLHAYWTFTQDVPVARWLPIARAFKALCVQHKLAIDLSVTADAARILRVPGTNNYKKDEPRPVQIVTLGDGPTEFDAFTARLPVQAAPVDLSAAKSFGTDEVTEALAVGQRQPAKFARIVKRSIGTTGCAQIKRALMEADTLEEPLWRAALSIAWNCTDGQTAIHKLSSSHPGYTAEDTTAKAERLTGKPYTCEWYRTNALAGCEGCKHRISSPIQLGAVVETAEVTDGAYVVETALNPDNELMVTTVEVSIPQYPFPYFRGKNGGVFKEDRDEDGNSTQVEIYPQDLYVTSRFFDSDEQGDGEGEQVGLNLHLPHDGIRRFHAPVVSLLTKDKLRDVLVKYGVIAYGKQLDNIMAYLASSIRKLQYSMASNKTRNQMGWTSEGNFVVGELEYTPVGVKLAPPASGTRQLAPLFHQRGNLEDWKRIVNYYNRPGMEGHAFGMFVGMGSCLLQLLNNNQVRGAVLNLVSNKSGTGKTTVQHVINSLFGHPSELLMEAKDTPASRFQRLGTLNSICMTVDELTNATGEQLSALVYGSTSGRGAHRMEAQGNRLRTNNTTWCSVTVTSSNAVMTDALAAHRTAVEGELKRVIDLHITIPTDIPKEESDAVFLGLTANYGVAGPIFIQHVVANRTEVSNLVKEMQLKIDREAKFARNDRFYSAVLAIAFTFAMISKKLGLHDIDVDRVYAYALKVMSEMKEATYTMVGASHTMAVETLSEYISDNINNMLIINKPEDGSTPPAPIVKPNGVLRLRYEPNTDELVIAASELRNYFVSRRVDFKDSLGQFKKLDALVTNQKTGETTAVRRLAAGLVGAMVTPAARCYVFKGAKLGVKIDVPTETSGSHTDD